MINMKWIGEHRVDSTARFDHEVYMHALDNTSASGGSYLVLDNSQVSTRTSAEVLADIGGLGSSATAAAATLLTATNHTVDTTCFPLFTGVATGNISAHTNSSLIYNSNTGALGASTLTTTGNITMVGTLHQDASASFGSRLEMSEGTDNGTSFVRIMAPASIGTTFGLTLPDNNGTASTATIMQSDGSGVLSFNNELNRKFTMSASDTDGDGQGDIVYFGTGSSVVGKIYHYKDDGSWELAVCTGVATCDGLLAVALGTDPDVDGMLLRGMVTLIDIQGTETVGGVLYLSETGGGGYADIVAPSANNEVVRVIGYCLTTDDQIWFNPDNTFVEVTV